MHREVEPEDELGALEHEVAQLVAVGAVDDPGVRMDERLDSRAELVRRRLGPVRSMVKRVELDERHREPLGELASERRLPVAARRRDHGHALHGSSRASSGVSEPGSTR
jgi:hypothetical protein